MLDREDDPTAAALRAAANAVGAVVPKGAVRRIGIALVQARLRGGAPPTLGRFRIQRKIGEGGMGAVFEAVDPRLDRTVALKVLHTSATDASRVDVEHEARMLARLSHPNVITVFELGDEAGEHYVCMEHIDGPNLASWLAANPNASWRTIVGHLLGAARGLLAAHRAGVVHRDFKPENVLVGADGIVRVTDFGLARFNAGEANRASDEKLDPMPEWSPAEPALASTLVGTPGYVAPEVLRGAEANERSDQYSYFVTLKVLLRRATATLPAALTALIQTGTSKDPAARLTDMSAVVSALEALLGQRPRLEQRTRDVLCERLQKLWIEPVRTRALQAHGSELALRSERVDSLVDTATPLDLGEGEPRDVAAALHALTAGVLIVGAPGAGKTIRLLGIAEALLQRRQEQDELVLPVVLNFSSFPGFDGSFSDWLLHELVAKYALPRQQAEQWLESRELALLLDGLDEVIAAERPRCVDALNQLRAERPTPYVVSCREENYRALGAKLRGDAALRLCPVDEATVASAVGALELSPRIAAFVQEDEALAEQLRSPLLLALFTKLANELDGPAIDASALRARLYGIALERALHRPHDPDTSAREGNVAGLRWLASAMTRVGVSELWLEEMQASWLPERHQRWLARGLGAGAAIALSIAINVVASQVAQQPWYSGVFFGVIGALAAFVIHGGVRVVPMEAMRWSWSRVRTWIPRNLALGVITGGLHGVFFDFWADLMLGIATGVFGLSVIGLVPAGRERRARPGDGLVESLRNGLVIAPIIGFVIGVPVGYLVLPVARRFADPTSMYYTHPNPEFSWAVTMGTSAAVTSLYITGFLAPLMHLALRITVAMTTPLPFHLTRWLDDMADRDLLNKVGGGWLFRHSTFRAWLASRESAGGSSAPD